MTTLNLFPVRVPIGKTTYIDPQGNEQQLEIYMTSEFARAMADLFERVGGEIGMSVEDLSVLSGDSSVASIATDLGVGSLSSDLSADIAALKATVQDLQAQLIEMGNNVGQVGGLKRSIEGIELMSFADPFRIAVDWTRPGAIGSAAPNTGAFTTLSTSGRISANLGLTVAGGTFISRGITDNATATALTLSAAGDCALTGALTAKGGAVFLATNTALTNGAAAAAGTIANAPTAGNPTKWIGINDNGTTRYIPSW